MNNKRSRAIKTRIVLDVIMDGEIGLANLINGKVLKLNQVIVKPIYPKKNNVVNLPVVSSAKH